MPLVTLPSMSPLAKGTWDESSDQDAPFSPAFRKDLKKFGVGAANLREMAQLCTDAMGFTTVISGPFSVNYEHGGTRLASIRVDHNTAWTKETLSSFAPFWGGREPRAVPDCEAWKCQYCAFVTECPEGKARHSRAVSRGRGMWGGSREHSKLSDLQVQAVVGGLRGAALGVGMAPASPTRGGGVNQG